MLNVYHYKHYEQESVFIKNWEWNLNYKRYTLKNSINFKLVEKAVCLMRNRLSSILSTLIGSEAAKLYQSKALCDLKMMEQAFNCEEPKMLPLKNKLQYSKKREIVQLSSQFFNFTAITFVFHVLENLSSRVRVMLALSIPLQIVNFFFLTFTCRLRFMS